MDIAGPVTMLAFGLDSGDSLPPELTRHLDGLQGRGILRILEVLFVSKASDGTFRAHPGSTALDAVATSPAVSTLWQLLVDESPESGFVTEGLLTQLTSWEVGIDLDRIERLGRLIEPGTSALLMLVQAKWAADLLDAVLRSGGFPIVFGFLERETMLVVGPDLAATSAAALATERAAARRGVALLEVLGDAQVPSPVATKVIAALVDGRLLDECDVDAAFGVLAAEGLVPPRLLARARAHADATHPEIASVRPRCDEPED